jgi:hypothetical protein
MTQDLDALLASYLDLARHLDPLRHPDEAPEELRQRLGRFDTPWLVAQAAALRSIAHAIEDLETVESLDDEVDRTMLLDTIRGDILAIEAVTQAEGANPTLALRHAMNALLELMGEGFDAAAEAALRARIAALPEFLATIQQDTRPIPEAVVADSVALLGELGDVLDEASEYLDDAAVQPALVAHAEIRQWLEADAPRGGPAGLGEEALERQLALLTHEPVGVRGTLRILEMRRAGVQRSLDAVALTLGSEAALALVEELREVAELDFDELATEWPECWERIRSEMASLGLPATDLPCMDDPLDALDRHSLPGAAIRAHAELMQDAACRAHPRPVRRILTAPGLSMGWGRTVAALLRGTEVGGGEEQQLMMCHRALVESVAAEVDLLLQARRLDRAGAVAFVREQTGLEELEAEGVVQEVSSQPLEALGAALAHEAWQSWYADQGGDPVAFIRRALDGGGLAVRLSRWALGAE